MSSNPLTPSADQPNDSAVNLIRAKVARVYSKEPNASDELAEVQDTKRPLSKHQQFMQELSASGKSLAEIQTAWHHYYTTLGDDEKHEVWQEFYQANQYTPYQKLFQKQTPVASRKHEEKPAPEPRSDGIVVADHTPAQIPETTQTRKLKQKVVKTVSANGKLTARHHLQSLGFGLASGFIVLVVLLFTFLNEYIIAPFIQPSRTVTNAPIILSDTATNLNAPPSITIPKINIQIPLVYDVPTVQEDAVEAGLKRGVVHYANTVMPGQNGNAAYFGHSAVNIFNNGEKYGFAFTLLHNLTTGDVFYITYSGKTYAYRIFDREVVPPSDVGVISDTKGKQATATLITCDPPGVSTNRLVLWGEQISPAITTNTAATIAAATTPTTLASNGPSLWSKFVNKVEFWN
jgi:LPXTG-site transpeptidase (sortase) family protein